MSGLRKNRLDESYEQNRGSKDRKAGSERNGLFTTQVDKGSCFTPNGEVLSEEQRGLCRVTEVQVDEKSDASMEE